MLHQAQGIILHSRNYRETSVLLDVFTREYGRLSLIARGARKNIKTGNALQQYALIDFVWFGNQEIAKLNSFELRKSITLSSKLLFSGLYINELLYRTIPKLIAYPKLFDAYLNTLHDFAQNHAYRLRKFEHDLLDALGYACDLTRTFDTEEAISPQMHYRFIPQMGLQKALNTHAQTISASALFAFADEQYFDDLITDEQRQVLSELKRLLQSAISNIVDLKLIKTKQLNH